MSAACDLLEKKQQQWPKKSMSNTVIMPGDNITS